MPRPICASCRNPLLGGDRHIICTSCLGRDHAFAALSQGGCPECDEMALQTLRARLAIFDDDPTPSALPLEPRKKQRCDQRQPEQLSEHTADLSLRVSPSPVTFTLEEQRPSLTVACSVSFGGPQREEEDDDDSLSQAASGSAWSDSVSEPAALMQTTTDLALRATKATAQAIRKSMASLTMLERHLWLNLTEMESDRAAFLDAPITTAGLFGPAVTGFAERFTEAQKASQAMKHFLPKRSSSASGHQAKAPPPQQPKAAPASTQPHSASDLDSAHAQQAATDCQSYGDLGPRLCWIPNRRSHPNRGEKERMVKSRCGRTTTVLSQPLSHSSLQPGDWRLQTCTQTPFLQRPKYITKRAFSM